MFHFVLNEAKDGTDKCCNCLVQKMFVFVCLTGLRKYFVSGMKMGGSGSRACGISVKDVPVFDKRFGHS